MSTSPTSLSSLPSCGTRRLQVGPRLPCGERDRDDQPREGIWGWIATLIASFHDTDNHSKMLATMINVANVLLHSHTTGPSRCSTRTTPRHTPQRSHSSTTGSPPLPRLHPALPPPRLHPTHPQVLRYHPNLDDCDDPRRTRRRSQSSPQHDKALSLDTHDPNSAQPVQPAQPKVARASPLHNPPDIAPRLRTLRHPRRPSPRRQPHRHAGTLILKGSVKGDVLVHSVDGVESESSPARRRCASAPLVLRGSKKRQARPGDQRRRLRWRQAPGRRRREQLREGHRRRVIAFGAIFPVIGQPDNQS